MVFNIDINILAEVPDKYIDILEKTVEYVNPLFDNKKYNKLLGKMRHLNYVCEDYAGTLFFESKYEIGRGFIDIYLKIYEDSLIPCLLMFFDDRDTGTNISISYLINKSNKELGVCCIDNFLNLVESVIKARKDD